MKRLIFYKKLILLLSLIFASSFIYSQSQTKHTVVKGETYYSISKKYGISVDELCSANNLNTSDVLKVGQILNIPQKTSAAISSSSAANSSSSASSSSSAASSANKNQSSTNTSETSSQKTDSSSNSANSTSNSANSTRKFDTYTVQKGDTFYRIAKINGISVSELKQINNLADDTILKVGDKLKIPVTILDTKNANLPDLPSNDPRNYSTKKGDSSLTWPVKNPKVTYMNGKVSGVQLSARKNEEVTAIRAGTVMYVGNYRGYGQVVFVQSKTGHIYVYSGLGTIKVKKGEYVVFGDVLGTAGTDSIKGTSQICLMVFQKSVPVDPAKAPRG